MVTINRIQNQQISQDEDAVMATAVVWEYQLDRHQVPIGAYKTLVNMAVDQRADEMRNGRYQSPFTVELLIAQWMQYKSASLEEYNRLKVRLSTLLDTRERFESGKLSEAQALVVLGGWVDIPPTVAKFSGFAEQQIELLKRKIETFKKERHIDE